MKPAISERPAEVTPPQPDPVEQHQGSWPVNWRTGLPSARFQIFRMRSLPPLARSLPSGLAADKHFHDSLDDE